MTLLLAIIKWVKHRAIKNNVSHTVDKVDGGSSLMN